MSDFEKCGLCGEFDWKSSHHCVPYSVYETDDTFRDENRWINVNNLGVHGHEQAAKKWAELQDQDGDYNICSGHSSPLVDVECIDTGEKKQFRIQGEMVPEYWAEEVKDE